MSRRSNSLIPAYPEPDDEWEELLPEVPPQLPPPHASPLALASQAADQVAARTVFEEYLERMSPNTRRRHVADLASFTEYLAAAGVAGIQTDALQSEPAAWREVSWGLVKGYVRWLMGVGYAIRTVNARLSTIKVYAGLAHEAGVLDQEAYSRIQLVKGYGRKQGKHTDEQRTKEEIPTRVGAKKAEATSIPDDIAHDLKHGHEDTPQGRRDALLMCLLLDHGLRCSEVADLRVEHFNLVEGSFTFYRRKVDLTQTHRMTRDTRRAAQAYISQDALPSGPLLRISNKHGLLGRTGLSVRAITKRVCELGKNLGLRPLSAHDCRHYWATTAVRNGTHVKDLQEAGGWASPAMPLAYAERGVIANEGVKLGKEQPGNDRSGR